MNPFFYFDNLKERWFGIQVANSENKLIPFNQGTNKVIDLIVSKKSEGKKICFIGNGGSSAIASHQAVDYWKCAQIRAVAFNDPSGLTCISNDFGYEFVFSKPVEMFMDKGDLLIAISSSGKSKNIIQAVKKAKSKACEVITLSGFEINNPLRLMGDINFYVPSKVYGEVEVLHLAILHFILDSIMGIKREVGSFLKKEFDKRKIPYDAYGIDTHKLIYHVERVNSWLKGENIYPVYIEISTSGICNFRCTFCALDYMGYQKRFLDKKVLIKRLQEMAPLGVKSVMYSGEGEPLLHKEIAEIIKETKNAGIDVAITTNGFYLKEKLARSILRDTTWIKVSINAGTSETYAKVHRTSEENFKIVLNNIKKAVMINNEYKKPCTIGAQILLLPENYKEVTMLAERLKEIGVDYFVIKPYSQHPLSITQIYKDIDYNQYLYLKDILENLSSPNFKIIFRDMTFKKTNQRERYYKVCQALPFWAYLDTGGNLWGCSAYLGKDKFLYGNIYKESFRNIWEGDLRKKSLKFVYLNLDISKCRKNCRMDEINRFLWDIKNPPLHVNFI